MANLQASVTSYPSVVITSETGVTVNSNQVYEEDTNLPFKAYRKKNLRRAITLSPATLMLLSSGMHIFWGIYTNIPRYADQYHYFHLIYSWFIGAVIGAIIAALLIRKYMRIYFMYSSGALLLLSGILFAALPLQYEAIAVARYLAGIAHGLIFVTAIIHAGEIAPKRLRGEYLSSVNICITGGLLVATFLYRIQLDGDSKLPVNRIYGIVHIILCIVGLVLVPFYFKESPLFLIDTGNDNEAFSMLLTLQKQTVETPGIRYQFVDTKNMVAEEENESGIIISDGNWTALIQAGLLRGLLALATSMPLNLIAYVPYVLTIKTSIAIVIPIVIRFFGEAMAYYVLDHIGRRNILLISTGGSGLFLIVWGILLVATDVSKLMVPLAVIIALYQFFLGAGLSPVSAVFIGEAFPLSKKALSVFSVVALECMLHLFVVLAVMSSYPQFNSTPLIFVTGVFLLVATGYFFKFFPETKGLSLRECRDTVKQSSSL